MDTHSGGERHRTCLMFLGILLLLAGHRIGAQPGPPFLRNFPPEEYQAHNQNWTALQDERGVTYVGNSKGLLEYDGVSWRLTRTHNKRIVRSMALDAQGRLYTGGHAEIGYMEPDALGCLAWTPLMPKLEARYRNFTDVWQTLATPEGVYFVATQYLFRWDGRAMRVWPAQTAFTNGAWLNGRLYVTQTDKGLMELVGGELRMAAGGGRLAQAHVTAIMPKAGGGMMLATRSNGLFTYDGIDIQRFTTEIDGQLSQIQLFCATLLKDGQYALGSTLEGVLIVNGQGRLTRRIGQAQGLLNNAVLGLYQDAQNGLWISTQSGVARAETGSPVSVFGRRQGVEGSVWESVRYEGRLYIATIMGLYVLDENLGRFDRIAGVSAQCWTLLPFDASLLVGTFDGVYEVRNGSGRRIADGFAFGLHRSKQDPNRVFVGMHMGLKSLYYAGGQWRDDGKLPGVPEEIRHIYEEPTGKLWLIDYFSALLRADFSGGYTPEPPIMRYDTASGLPPADRVVAFPTDQGLRFATLRGVYGFDEQQQRFRPDTALVQGLDETSISLFAAATSAAGDLWLVDDENMRSGVAWRRQPGQYEWDPTPFLRMAGRPVFSVYPDPLLRGITWVGGEGEMLRYDRSTTPNHATPFKTLVRQVAINGDSVVYGGWGNGPEGGLRMAYANQWVRFRYAAATFDEPEKNQYQYWLEGYDDDWSDWTSETSKDYTRLSPGRYRFQVRARNRYGTLGEPAAFDFRVMPPFYLSWWAYSLYALLLAGGIRWLRRRELRRIQAKHQRELKQVEYEKLKELDQLKSRFFADISHEFRTPLTLILGPVEALLAQKSDPEQSRQYTLIQRNAQRLLRLINQLLDLSKLEAGKMQLEPAPHDLVLLAKSITYSFESMAQSKNINLLFTSALEQAVLLIDRDKLEQVLANLISNALKFTPVGGAVAVQLALINNGATLEISVQDSGPGIADSHLPRIFDRFYQVLDTAATSGEPGTGIGLALAKELTELHGGRITVSNTAGQGACFRIWLPYAAMKAPVSALPKPMPTAEKPTAQVPPTLPDPAEMERENTLLLVEDNADMRAFIRETLAPDYRVLEAPDGQEGLELAFAHTPDLIISDVMMPFVSGLELCARLKTDERSSHIPIVLLTAKADIESKLAGLERGADDYLAKPFHREELRIRVRNLLTARQRLRERYALGAPPPKPTADKGLQIEDAFLQKVRAAAAPYLTDSAFEIDQLAQLLGMSRSQLFRKIKALTGLSPSLFIRSLRLQRAKELLETTDKNVSEVAYEAGFSTPAYFSDAFLEAYGIRPSQLKK